MPIEVALLSTAGPDRIRIARRAAVLASCLLLAGCTTTAPEPSVAPTTADAVPDFPRIPGRILDTSSPIAGDWLVRIRVADAKQAYGDARRTLVQAGYSLTKDREGADGGDGQACTTELCVSFTALAARDATGPTVLYEVFHSTGIAPD